MRNNLDVITGKVVIKVNEKLIRVNDALNILGIIDDKKLEELNYKCGFRIVRTNDILERRYSKN